MVPEVFADSEKTIRHVFMLISLMLTCVMQQEVKCITSSIKSSSSVVFLFVFCFVLVKRDTKTSPMASTRLSVLV